VPVGAGGDALRRIEASLAADDPDLVECFRRWRLPAGADPTDDGTMWVRGWAWVVLAIGMTMLVAGPTGVLVFLVIWIPLRLCGGQWHRSQE
jgi:Protein of unknown function (DUF3040)